ncbi:MAG: glycosyltransferase family 2 protein [Candidatus Pacebacteria bacterium]|nr:glycosyltransferase family 2 protein [Candidatus Paceibacterota bacterium]
MSKCSSLAACVLTHNSEACLEKCLKSLKFCDETIVVDDNSTDKTMQIAKKYGARIFQRSLNGDYAKQRNFGLKMAKFEWVLFVDSDESIPSPLKKEIHKKLKSVKPNTAAFACRRDDYFLGQLLSHGPAAKNYLVRLLRKDSSKWIVAQPEKVLAEGEILNLEHKIRHQRQENLHQYIEKVNRYSTLEATWHYKNGESSVRHKIISQPIKYFYKSFFEMEGRKDGMPGFILCAMIAIIQFFVQLKLWEFYEHEKQH